MKTNDFIFSISTGVIIGIASVARGYSVVSWQWWAFSIPLIIVVNVVWFSVWKKKQK